MGSETTFKVSPREGESKHGKIKIGAKRGPFLDGKKSSGRSCDDTKVIKLEKRRREKKNRPNKGAMVLR